MNKVLLRRSDFKLLSTFDEIAKVMGVETAFSNKIILFVKDAVALSSTETKTEQAKKMFAKMDEIESSNEYQVQWKDEKSLFENRENKTFSSLRQAYNYAKSCISEITSMIDDESGIKLFNGKKLVCVIMRVGVDPATGMTKEDFRENIKEPREEGIKNG